jgi:hypothetical protein
MGFVKRNVNHGEATFASTNGPKTTPARISPINFGWERRSATYPNACDARRNMPRITIETPISDSDIGNTLNTELVHKAQKRSAEDMRRPGEQHKKIA